MVEKAKHRVYVWRVNEKIPHPDDKYSRIQRMIPTGRTKVEWDIDAHPEECDQLKYDQVCALDRLIAEAPEDMPKESGTYDVWAIIDGGRNYYGEWEDDSQIDYERVGDLQPPYSDEPYETWPLAQGML